MKITSLSAGRQIHLALAAALSAAALCLGAPCVNTYAEDTPIELNLNDFTTDVTGDGYTYTSSDRISELKITRDGSFSINSGGETIIDKKIVVDPGNGKHIDITLDNISIDMGYNNYYPYHCPLQIKSGSAKIYLRGTNTLISKGSFAALNVLDGASVEILAFDGVDENNTLDVRITQGGDGACIGGNFKSTFGDITISGGTINAGFDTVDGRAVSQGAAIGSGGNSPDATGTITINGGLKLPRLKSRGSKVLSSLRSDTARQWTATLYTDHSWVSLKTSWARPPLRPFATLWAAPCGPASKPYVTL
jgi:hypothetical protein